MSDESADFSSGCSRACARVHNRNPVPRLERLLLVNAANLAPARLPRRPLNDHRLSLDGGVPARQARDLSAGSDVVGRLAGADVLPAAERRPGEASSRDLLQDDPHRMCSSSWKREGHPLTTTYRRPSRWS
jgi:hypothetical protein